MKAKDRLTGTQAAGSFLLYHTDGKKGYLSFLSFLVTATASSRQGGKQVCDLDG